MAESQRERKKEKMVHNGQAKIERYIDKYIDR